jgi:hypothetical protein
MGHLAKPTVCEPAGRSRMPLRLGARAGFVALLLATAGIPSATGAAASAPPIVLAPPIVSTPSIAPPIAGASAHAVGAGAPAPPSAVYANNQYEPSVLAIKPHGHYSHISVHNLVWADWGQPTATAHGILTFQFCVHESCSVSPFYDEPTAVSLGAIKRCRARFSYTTLALDVEGPLPDPNFKAYRTVVGVCSKRRSRGH